MKVLVVKLADLGDLLLSEPALRSFRLAYPDAEIDVLTTPHAARLLPHLDDQARSITFDKSPFDVPGLGSAASGWSLARLGARLATARYDAVVILHHLTTAWGTAKYRALALSTRSRVIAGLDNGRGAFLTHRSLDHGFGYKHEAEYMLDVARLAGGAATAFEPRFQMESENTPFGLPESYVIIAPSAGDFAAAKIWPVERFVELSLQLATGKHKIVVVGGEDAFEAGQRIVDRLGDSRAFNAAGRTSINQLAITIKHADLLIGNDSFPIHLAAAIGTPTLSIFGPSNPAAWKPLGSRTSVVWMNLPCAPCLYTGYRLGRPAGCPARTCLDLITPEMVRESALELLDA